MQPSDGRSQLGGRLCVCVCVSTCVYVCEYLCERERDRKTERKGKSEGNATHRESKLGREQGTEGGRRTWPHSARREGWHLGPNAPSHVPVAPCLANCQHLSG